MTTYTFQPETIVALSQVPPNTRASQDSGLGVKYLEPVLIGLDSMLRYAKAYEKQFDQKLSQDYMARDEFLGIITGYRALLNFDGAVAWELDKRGDSKDNSVCESIFWEALKAGGFSEADI